MASSYFHMCDPGHYTVLASKAYVSHGSAGVDVHAGHTSSVHIDLP